MGELRAGIAEGGMDPRTVPLYETEAAAVRGELTDPARVASSDRPGVLVLMCHAERDEVRDVLTELGFSPLDASAAVALATASGNGYPSGAESSPGSEMARPARGPRSSAMASR